MFVNSVPFLVSVSRTINLITIEHAPKRTATKLCDLIQRIVPVYARAGFTVQTNLPAASEHVGKIERRIRVVIERARGLACTLPYPCLP
jgi:hypothetical protein